MKKKYLPIIFFLIVSTVLIFSHTFSQEFSDSKDIRTLYPTTTVWYRGVVAQDIGDGDLNEELVCDFGPLGLWVYDIATKWRRITPDNPEWIIGIQFTPGDFEIVADFGALGLWWWDYPNTWTKISSNDAENGYAVDDNGDGVDELHVDFGEIGIWRWDNVSKTWSRLSGWNPDYTLQSDSWTVGIQEICYDFGAGGLYVCSWPPNNPTWTKLSPNNIGGDHGAGHMGAGDLATEMAFDFESLGLWIYQHDSIPHWHKITGDFVVDLITARIMGGTDYDLVVQFNTIDGLWIWDYDGGWPGKWLRITSDNPTWDEAYCEPFDPDGLIELSGQEEFAADFNSLGLWLYDHHSSPKWTKISDWSPHFMVRADLNGVGTDTCLVCDFETKGLWYYDGGKKAFIKLSSDTPDSQNN
jgi:hypothetical protein